MNVITLFVEIYRIPFTRLVLKTIILHIVSLTISSILSSPVGVRRIMVLKVNAILVIHSLRKTENIGQESMIYHEKRMIARILYIQRVK